MLRATSNGKSAPRRHAAQYSLEVDHRVCVPLISLTRPAVIESRANPITIIELTATLCEDHATCMIVVEPADSTLLGRSFDWPPLVPFSEADVLAELQRLDPSRCVH